MVEFIYEEFLEDMIILITGTTHTGKTKLAQRMLEKYKYPYLSIDHLKMGLIRSGNTDLTVEDDEKLTGYLWNIVKEMIKTAIENKQNLIVEGCYIPFTWKQDFDEIYLSQIRYICLCLSEDYVENCFEKIKSHSCDIEDRLDDSGCTVELLKKGNQFYNDGCKQHGLPMVLVEDNYEIEVDKILENII